MPKVRRNMNKLINQIPSIKTLKQEQVTRGYLGYYFAFAGKIHSLVNRVIKEPTEEGLAMLKHFLKYDTITILPKAIKEIHAYSDATPECAAAILTRKKKAAIENFGSIPIIVAETIAAVMAINLYKTFYNYNYKLKLHVTICPLNSFLERGPVNGKSRCIYIST